ncbi:MAG TPA: DMT family transporter [Methylomirabilota bacterium]
MPGASQTRAYAALLLIVGLWGSFPATGKLALVDFPPAFLTLVRIAIASVFLCVMLVRAGEREMRAVTPTALRVFFVLALTGIWGSTQLSYLGYYFTTAANAVVLQAAAPVMVALGARAYLGERLRRVQQVGVLVSTLGVFLVITEGRLAALRLQELRAGDFITIAGLLGWTAYTVYGKRVLTSYSPLLATTGAYVIGTLLLIPTAVVAAPLFPSPRLTSAVAWAVVVYQALFGAVAHIWWYRAMDVVGPSRAAMFMNLQPLVGLALAAVLVGEDIGGWQLAGVGCILGGVALTTRAAGPGPPARPHVAG